MRHLIFIISIISSSITLAEWSPPASPDPDKILDEARQDSRDGNYEDALSKHIWFHNHSLQYQPSLYGVRLSYALSYWKSLADKYPPALEALFNAIDNARETVQQGVNYDESFHDYESLNKVLGDEYRTAQLFLWLDNNRPKRAEKVYHIAQPSLIKSGEYEICGKYIDPQNSFLGYVHDFRLGLESAEHTGDSHKAKLADFAYNLFSNRVSTLVALLVINDRKAEAKNIADMALLEWGDREFSLMLSDALKGSVPDPWP